VKGGGFWYLGHWYELTPLLPAAQRGELPETVPHEEIASHPILCPCEPCARYPMPIRRDVKRRWRAKHGPVYTH